MNLIRATLWLSVLAPFASYAYIPPASFIFDRMMKARDGLKALELVAEVKDLQRNITFTETLRLDFAGGRYWSVVTEAGGPLASSKFGRLTDLKALSQAWIEMAYDPSDSRVRDALQKHQVWPNEKTETKLVRESGKVKWAWGSGNEFRVEKDQFVWAGFKDDDKNEVLVKDQARFPKLILVRGRGQDKFLYNLKGFKINGLVKWNTNNQVNPQGNFADPVREWVELVR